MNVNHLRATYSVLQTRPRPRPRATPQTPPIARLRKLAFARLPACSFRGCKQSRPLGWAVGKRDVLALAIFQLSVKPIRRSQGGDARAAAAYRSGIRIGPHDYTRRRGVADRALFLPDQAPAWDRAQLWEAAEKAERRKNSVTAREVLLALPHEMPLDGQRKATEAFCWWLVRRYQCAADAALHTPRSGHDARNVHAHILITTRRLTAYGLAEKTRELDDQTTGPLEVEAMREAWARILEGHGFNLEHRAARRVAPPPLTPTRNTPRRADAPPPPQA